MKLFFSYLKADSKRLLRPARLVLPTALAVGVLLLATREEINLNTDVLYVFSLVMYGMPSMMLLICGAIAFAGSLCEDAEHKYRMQQILRGNASAYLSARMASIFLAAMLTTALGIFIFSNILHLRLAWADTSASPQYEHLLRSGGLRIFLRNRRFGLYFLCYGIQYGFLSGNLALWASCLSLYIPNRMLVLASPMILYYFADYLLAGLFPGLINLGLIFSPAYNLFSDDFLSALSVLLITLVNVLLLRMIMLRKIRTDNRSA